MRIVARTALQTELVTRHDVHVAFDALLRKAIHFPAARGNPASRLVGIAQSYTEHIEKGSRYVEYQMISGMGGEVQSDIIWGRDSGGRCSPGQIGKYVMELMRWDGLGFHGVSLLLSIEFCYKP